MGRRFTPRAAQFYLLGSALHPEDRPTVCEAPSLVEGTNGPDYWPEEPAATCVCGVRAPPLTFDNGLKACHSCGRHLEDPNEP